ncbi:hypothetical protein [Saccharibacillus kuerlensis]|uniref:Alcohol dehydrogenase n=1 Tax=Saccharibacillus kuerlensis TaxID=459527 RepID=A0ABQ2LA89_9BACL|nr:hypothetical protein GCM10010969_37540 [Saccharibacillus kuerlensis]
MTQAHTPAAMKAAAMHNLREITIEDVPVPEIGPNKVLIKVISQ